MQNNVMKPMESMEELFRFLHQSASNERSEDCYDGSRERINVSGLESLKESINQVRQRLELLVMEPECKLIDEEILSVSQALDQLICAYQKNYEVYQDLTYQQEHLIPRNQERRCCNGRC